MRAGPRRGQLTASTLLFPFVVFLGASQAFAQSAAISVAPIASAVAGNSITIRWTVKNTGTTTRTFGVGVEIEHGGPTPVQVGQATTPMISPGDTATGSLPFAIPADWPFGTDTARAVVWSGTPGLSTRLWTYDRPFAVQARATSATIMVASIPAVVSGNLISVYYTVKNTGNYARTFGVGAEIEHGGPSPAEVGQATTPTISPGDSSSGSFQFAVPADWPAGTDTARAAVWTDAPGGANSTWLGSYDRRFTVQARITTATITVSSIATVVAGNEISIAYRVKNTGNYARSFGVGAEIEHGEPTAAQVGQSTTPTVNPGDSASGSFPYTVPSDWPAGTDTARTAVWTGTPGGTNSIWLNRYDRSFTVQQAPLTVLGRIAYHSYSQALTPPGATDGQIFLYSLPNGPPRNLTFGLKVKNAMNPSFSPDGSRIVFMAIPQDSAAAWTSMHIYVYDLAQERLERVDTSMHYGGSQDPKFSPDGVSIVFKRSLNNGDGQIYRMNADGTGADALTSGGHERSGPNYSPDGSRILFWYDSHANADIGWMQASVRYSDAVLVSTPNVQEMYPSYRDNDSFLYTRWDNSTDTHDHIYLYSFSTPSPERLKLNSDSANDSDPFPIGDSYVGFSSDSGASHHWSIYIGSRSTSNVYKLSGQNDAFHNLGGTYTPYSHARELVILAPTQGAQPSSASTAVLSVRAYSDGGTWSGASPSVTFQGPTTVVYGGLHDDGTNGDAVAGDGIYSSSVVLPSQPGVYTLTASANSYDNGINHVLSSASVTVTVLAVPVALSVSPQVRRDSVVQGSTVARLDSATVTLTGTYAGTTGWLTTHHGSRAPWLRLIDSIGTGSGMLRWRRDPTGLSVGLYVDTLTVTAGTPSVTVIDSFRIVAPLALAVSPPVRRDSVAQGATALRSDSASVTLTGSNSGTTGWVTTHHGSRAAWLRLVDSSGAGSGMLRWRRDPTGLSVGLYVDTLGVTASTLSATVLDSFRIVALTLTVTPPLHVDSVVQGATAQRTDSASVTLAGTGAGTTTWLAVHHGSRASWLRLGDSSGTGSGMLRWHRDPTGLNVGLYVDTLTVSAATLSATVIDSFRVVAPLAVAVIPLVHVDSVALGATALRRDSASVTITGTNAGATTWLATHHGIRATWVRLVDSTGNGTGTLRWQRNPTGLGVGAYVDSLTVTAGLLGATVVDSFRIVASLALTVSPLVHRDSVAQGSTALRQDSASISLTGSNAFATSWVATHHGSHATWLRLVDSTGTGSGTLRWKRDPASLTEGVYVDTLVVTAGSLSAAVIDSLHISVPAYWLTILGTGAGTGTASSAPAGIACTLDAGAPSGSCAHSFPSGTTVVLTPQPSGPSVFTGWIGTTCATSADCSVTINQDLHVTVRFEVVSLDQLVSDVLTGSGLTPDQATGLDRHGNRNGRFDLGDFVAWLDRSGISLTPDVMRRIQQRLPR